MSDTLHPLFKGIIEGLILPPAQEPEDHTADMAREDYERDQADAEERHAERASERSWLSRHYGKEAQLR